MLKFIIYTPLYRDDSGGIIVLHKLYQMLTDMGHEVSIWRENRPHRTELLTPLITIKKSLKYLRDSLFFSQRFLLPTKLKVSKHSDIKHSIVIYPEIIDGNPLKAQHVVRWFLNKPGELTGKVRYGKDELYFFFDKHFDDSSINPNSGNHLNVLELKQNIYKQTNFETRVGMCHMIRKGEGRILNQHSPDSILIDGLSHEETAKIFNKCKYFVCYDLYTMYVVYAAMCGCIPVVIGEEELSEFEWHSKIENRYGLAYGWDRIDWAISTRRNMMEHLAECEDRSRRSVETFIQKCKKEFFDNTKACDS